MNQNRTIRHRSLCLLISAAFVAGLVMLVTLAAGGRAAPQQDWTTFYEKSAYQATPRYAETVDFCRGLAAASPVFHYLSFGTSPQGRELPLLVADREGLCTPEAARAAGRTVILVEAGIHPGEISGKDAGLLLLRNLLVGQQSLDLLDGVTLLFVPIFNVDGHERFGPYNRINQNGPVEMGWRTNAANLNLNRDFLKADTPEMQAWLRLFAAWLPDFFVDIHATDGADYQYAISYALELHGNLETGLTSWARERYLPALEAAMTARGFPLTPYVIFRRWHDPRSGLVSWAASPRLSEGYVALQNRPGLLVETHMLKPYRVRVEAVYALLLETLRLLQGEGPELQARVRAADAAASDGALRREPFPLRFRATADSVMIDFLGVSYEEVTSEITGGTWIRYGREPVTYRIPYFDRQEPTVSVQVPEGYLVPPEWPAVAERLALHGVALRRLAVPVTLTVRSYRFRDVSWQEQPYEGRHPLDFQVESIREERELPAGTWVVDLRQRAARVAIHVLEPQAPDSYVQWGFFDPIFSRTEYVESYVIEAMAREMLARDPDLARQLEAAKAADPEFAGDPRAIRDWFYRRTPYCDDRVNIYPVGLIDDRAVLEALPLE
jgi:hypothetical protein